MLFRLFRNAVFLTWLVVVLASTSIAASIWAATMTFKVAQVSTEAAAAAIRHRKTIRKALLRAKARARLQRYVIAVPFVGAVAVTYFEKQDYDEWKAENTEGTPQEYGCLIYSESKDIVAEIESDANSFLEEAYENLPSWVPGWVQISLPDLDKHLPTCNATGVSDDTLNSY